MTHPVPSSVVSYVEGFEPGYLGRITQMHGEYYAKAWGAGADYEAQTAHEIAEFCEHYDLEKDLLLTAHLAGVLVGCIAIVGTQSEYPGQARLRWFLLEEPVQGQGIGSQLLERALTFCRTQRFPSV
ncbi:MAG: transcriptional regulator, MarR family with acetyltransferase [Chthonomonadaceae bacterium]|nr:transcriptional regulator, MarR family with acetyltransferase [Chthonomonadaceae bacterium]